MTTYQLYTDGGARGNPGPAGVGFVLKKNGKKVKEFGQYIGVATNNQAEYQALIMGLAYWLEAEDTESSTIDLMLDSELIVKQIEGSYKVRDDKLKPLYAKAKSMLHGCQKFTIQHIPRSLNAEADKLVNMAIDEATSKRPNS